MPMIATKDAAVNAHRFQVIRAGWRLFGGSASLHVNSDAHRLPSLPSAARLAQGEMTKGEERAIFRSLFALRPTCDCVRYGRRERLPSSSADSPALAAAAGLMMWLICCRASSRWRFVATSVVRFCAAASSASSCLSSPRSIDLISPVLAGGAAPPRPPPPPPPPRPPAAAPAAGGLILLPTSVRYARCKPRE